MKNLYFSVLHGIAVTFAIVCLASCSFEDPEDLYPYTTVLFVYQDYNRNVVVGEGLQINAGITFAGMIDNKKDRIVEYVIDPSLVTAANQSVLPSSYYTLGHASQIVVPKGELKGYLPVIIDSTAFLNDPKSLTGEYVLPLRIISSSDVDSIPEATNHIRISLSYYAKQHGYYNYSGSVTKTKDGVADGIVNYKNIPTETNSIRFLQTYGPTSFAVLADTKNNDDPAKDYIFLLDVPTSGGGAVTISPHPDSPVEVHPDGNCTYDAENRTFHLSYTYTLPDGTVCAVSEELVFRNRIRDVQSNGLYINEWR
ncbi:DUF1735 domain-containing protein [uncultured Proteiniphilum sp.]|uniref:BT_3987 domain-containing protein n=1 Tax=uncultured Proteiniphilum sp. TaxID=497637 RepID=UPI002601971C|nr:DUF1735 domain-containing protein [uncultured Proteiniphilum sp.]